MLNSITIFSFIFSSLYLFILNHEFISSFYGDGSQRNGAPLRIKINIVKHITCQKDIRKWIFIIQQKKLLKKANTKSKGRVLKDDEKNFKSQIPSLSLASPGCMYTLKCDDLLKRMTLSYFIVATYLCYKKNVLFICWIPISLKEKESDLIGR